MRADRRNEGDRVVFIISELEPSLEEAVRALGFSSVEGGFGQAYPTHPHIDTIYRNFETRVEELVLQKARLRPVAWERALLLFCEAVRGESIAWWLTGSGALAVRGLDVAPGDLDLIVGRESTPRVERLMLDHLIEPPRPGFISDTFTRSFPGACLEWCAGIDERADQWAVGDVGLTAAARLETVPWRGYEIRVPPLDLQLAVNERRGYGDRVRLIERAMSEHRS